MFLAAALYIGWVTLLERAGHCQKQALPHGCLFRFTGASFPGFCYPTLHIFVSPNLAKSSYKKTKKKGRKKHWFRDPPGLSFVLFLILSLSLCPRTSRVYLCLSVCCTASLLLLPTAHPLRPAHVHQKERTHRVEEGLRQLQNVTIILPRHPTENKKPEKKTKIVKKHTHPTNNNSDYFPILYTSSHLVVNNA